MTFSKNILDENIKKNIVLRKNFLKKGNSDFLEVLRTQR